MNLGRGVATREQERAGDRSCDATERNESQSRYAAGRSATLIQLRMRYAPSQR